MNKNLNYDVSENKGVWRLEKNRVIEVPSAGYYPDTYGYHSYPYGYYGSRGSGYRGHGGAGYYGSRSPGYRGHGGHRR